MKQSEQTKVHLYQRISKILRKEVMSSYRPGDLLPSENDLAKRFEVNRHTIRHAVDDLIEEGLISRQQGRGAVVLRPPIDYNINKGTQFTQTIEALGQHPNSIVTNKQRLRASGGVAQKLKLNPGTLVISMELLRLVDEIPVAVGTYFFPYSIMGEAIETFQGQSLHTMFREELGITPRRVETIISARMPMIDDAQALRMSPKLPIMRAKTVNVNDATDEPIEYVISRFRADVFQFKIEP